MNNDLIKAVHSVEKINKDKLLKEKYKEKDKDINNEGFNVLLDEEITKLRQQKEELNNNKKYINIIKELYEKENKHKKI